jgi:phosphoribosylamine--glycine ligase
MGQLPDGRDKYSQALPYTDHHVHLQQNEGVEVGIGRFFNGDDWVGPIEINFEHKSLMPGGIGPKTPEMGTLMWYDEDESNILFRETLFKLSQHLREIGFHGDFDVNCIVNGEGVWPLEATARFGDPSTAMQAELHLSPWGEFLGAIADKHQYKLNFKRGYGIVVTVAIPVPYEYFVGVPRKTLRYTFVNQ